MILYILLFLTVQLCESFSANAANHHNSGSRIVFGTAAISQADNPLEILDKAYYECGVRRFDLARTYGLGKSEEIFGQWLESRDIDRSTLSIITKGGMGNDKYGDPERDILTQACLMKEVEKSLDVIKVDCVDVYMYHRDDPRIPVEKFVLWANEIIDAGKTIAWGVSNWSFERFVEAHEYAIRENLVPPTSNSPQLSLANPACEVWPTTYSVSGKEHLKEIEWYNERGVELICWEVLAKGFMAVENLWCEKSVDPAFLKKEVVQGSDDWRLQRIQRAYCTEENYRRRRNALRVAEEFDKTLAQITVLYALSVSPNVSVILGFLEPDQLDDVKDLHYYYLDKSSVIGNSEEIERSPKLLDSRDFLNFNPSASTSYSKNGKEILV